MPKAKRLIALSSPVLYSQDLRPANFCPPRDEELRRQLARKTIKIVEIEIFSFCNRRCGFCPNSTLDRHSHNVFLPEETYLKVLRELAQIEYPGRFSFTRYNEPLADDIIYRRIAQARQYLPNAIIHTNTNGDYVTPEVIRKLYDAGLDSLFIQAYFPPNEEFSTDGALRQIERQVVKTGCAFTGHEQIAGNQLIREGRYKELTLRVMAVDFAKHICDRAGLLDEGKIPRDVPCYYPVNSLAIDYNGMVMPCCNLRSDAPEHRDYIVGSVLESTLLDIYFGNKMTEMRNNLFYYSNTFPKPCQNCSLGVPGRLRSKRLPLELRRRLDEVLFSRLGDMFDISGHYGMCPVCDEVVEADPGTGFPEFCPKCATAVAPPRNSGDEINPDIVAANIDLLLRRYGNVAFWGIGNLFKQYVPPDSIRNDAVVLVDRERLDSYAGKQIKNIAAIAADNIRCVVVCVVTSAAGFKRMAEEAVTQYGVERVLFVKELATGIVDTASCGSLE